VCTKAAHVYEIPCTWRRNVRADVAEMPEVGRQAAHILLDAVTAFEAGRADEDNVVAMNLALQRLDEVGAIGATTARTGEITLEVSNLAGGAVVSLNWLIEQLAFREGSDPQAVIARLRDFLDR